MKIKINEGRNDRIIRVMVGLILIIFALNLFTTISTSLVWISAILGAILVVTGIVGFCPLYSLFKINTNKQ